MHATSYLLKLQIDHVVLDGHGQAYQGMPKEAFETYIYIKHCWKVKVEMIFAMTFNDHLNVQNVLQFQRD